MDEQLLVISGEDHNLRLPLLRALRDIGFRVTIAITCCPDRFPRSGVHYQAFELEGSVNPTAYKRASACLHQLVTHLNPDIVQTFGTGPSLLVPLALQGRGPPVVRTINETDWLHGSHAPRALAFRTVYRILDRWVSCWTEMTIFENVDDRASFQRQGMACADRSLVIPGPAIDIRECQAAMSAGLETQAYREEFGLEDRQVVLAVIGLGRKAELARLLSAAARVHARRPEARFLLVGPRPEDCSPAVSRKEIDAHKGYVIFTGQRVDTTSLMKVADVFVTSAEDGRGIPRALLEAALAGVPLVSTDTPGCCDIVRDGRTGRLVPPYAPELLACSIIYMLDNREVGRTMAARAGDFVRSRLSVDCIVSRYERLYRNILEGRADVARRPMSRFSY